MKTERGYAVHTACLTAMFLLGNAVIVIPFRGANELTFVGFMLAAAVAILLSLLLVPLVAKLFSVNLDSGGRVQKLAVGVLWIAVCGACVAEAAVCFSTFTDFVGEVILPDGNRWLIAAVFFCAVALPCVKHKSVALKFSLFSFIITAVAVVFFLAAAFGEFRFENITLMRLPNLLLVAKQTSPYLLRVFPSLVIVYIYVGIHFGSSKRKPILLGVALGSGLLGLCLLNTLLLFGAPLAAQLDFPYASAISTITLGELFTRMDGFSYFIYFAACTVKLIVCISVIRALVSRSGEKRERAGALFALAMAVSIGLII